MDRKSLTGLVIAATAVITAFFSCNGDSEYTRGIGIYPGRPSEAFAPKPVEAEKEYRNLALLRKAYGSSSHDYNLTAQLVSDGIITESRPQYLVLSTPEGEVPRREREWMIDDGPYSRNTFYGADTYFQFSLHGGSREVDRLRLVGRMVYDRSSATEGYSIVCMGSDDGETWTEIGRQGGTGLPGEELVNPRKETDANKQTARAEIPERRLDETIPLQKSDFQHYRVLLKMAGAHRWTFMSADFMCSGEPVDMKPSQYFSSAWMSAGTGDEWVYVDLGCRCRFDKVVLHWVNKAMRGKIQVSDDALRWKDIAGLPGTDGSLDEISFRRCKARYVRVMMEESADGGRYILSEMEVMGKGGLTVRPAASAAPSSDRISLSGGAWRLQRASETSAPGETISSSDFEPEGWIVATVPGTVQTSYLNIGAIPDPNLADNQLQISESFFNSDFWYRNEFEIPSGFGRGRVFLNFDGINWKADVYVNGHQAGRIEGAFMRGRFDVTELIVGGRNVIAVRIIKNQHIGAVKEKTAVSPDFNGGIIGGDNPTFHASVGWDWIPTIRGRNIGIWNDVYLCSCGPVTVADPLVTSVLPLPDTTSAVLTAEVFVRNHTEEPVKGLLKGAVGDISFEKEIELEAGEERRVTFDAEEFPLLKMESPRLWWPNGYGGQNLYPSRFSFIIDGNESDSKDFMTGIRQVTAVYENEALELYVNGRRFIGRGGNWGMSEANLNYRGREYDTALAYHADMNLNMVRNWVGMTGDEEFYEACDRHGIMIWQDFWLANPADGPDPYNPSMFMANAEDYVRRIRSHASLCLYCGRNEGFPPADIDSGLRALVRKEHGDLHYISNSAAEGVSGHGAYRLMDLSYYYTTKRGKDTFHSERGMPNVMTYESLRRAIAADALWPQSDQWGMHDYNLEGAQRVSTFNEAVSKGYGGPHDAKEFSELAQWVNFDGHRALFESRSLNRKGLLMWMSHPAFPSLVFQTYDWFFEPTAAYFAIKKASEPIHIQWNPVSNEIEAVNYNAGDLKGLTAEVQVLNMDGTLAWEKKVSLDSSEDSTERLFSVEFPESLSKVHFIKMRLLDGGKVISDNFYHRSKEEGVYTDLQTLPKVELKTRIRTFKDTDGQCRGTVMIENKSSIPALMIRVNVTGSKDGEQILPMFWSDNWFHLLPGEKKEVILKWKSEDTRGNSPKVSVTGYNI